MNASLLNLISIAHQHAETESTQDDVDVILATMEGEPTYEFHPLGMKFTGMVNTRRYYEHFIKYFRPKAVNFKALSVSMGTEGVVQEYDVSVLHEGDDAPTSHRIIALLVFGQNGLSGERMFSDEKLFRAMIGPLWSELRPVDSR